MYIFFCQDHPARDSILRLNHQGTRLRVYNRPRIHICHNYNQSRYTIAFRYTLKRLISKSMQTGVSFFDKKAPKVAIRSLFDKYDANSNGKLEEQEMQFLLEGDLGLNQEQSWAYFLLLDKNGDHNISFEEFQDWLRSGERFEILNDKGKYHSLSEALNYFKSFDSDDSDTLDRVQFEKMMKFFGYESINMEKAFAEIDKDGNGAVSFWEFMVWLKWVPVLN